MPKYHENPPWKEVSSPQTQFSITRVGKKGTQTEVYKLYTKEHSHYSYFKTTGLTNGSAEDAVRSGGAGVYRKYPGGSEDIPCYQPVLHKLQN